MLPVPGTASAWIGSEEDSARGRALVYPVYKGTYERHVPFSFPPNEWRDLIILWSKDVRSPGARFSTRRRK